MDRIIEISKKLGHNHIGSSLTAYPIIKEIYKLKKPDEKFVLSNGHAGLALYVTLFDDNEAKWIKNNIHADKNWCDCSTGSLGHGLGIAVGMALSDRSKNVYCMVSDGECAEGSIWEALRIAAEQDLRNLKVYCACNGYASYGKVDIEYLKSRIKSFRFPVEFRFVDVEKFPEWLRGQKAHYAKVPQDEEITEIVKNLPDMQTEF